MAKDHRLFFYPDAAMVNLVRKICATIKKHKNNRLTQVRVGHMAHLRHMTHLTSGIMSPNANECGMKQ